MNASVSRLLFTTGTQLRTYSDVFGGITDSSPKKSTFTYFQLFC